MAAPSTINRAEFPMTIMAYGNRRRYHGVGQGSRKRGPRAISGRDVGHFSRGPQMDAFCARFRDYDKTARQGKGWGIGVSYRMGGGGVEIKEMISCMSYACPLIASGARSKK